VEQKQRKFTSTFRPESGLIYIYNGHGGGVAEGVGIAESGTLGENNNSGRVYSTFRPESDLRQEELYR
ncbi:MAG: hypothetical protein PV344_06245, partial [Anaplasma sp.]|nr:hypothetical protein [Anaplasma sp.]